MGDRTAEPVRPAVPETARGAEHLEPHRAITLSMARVAQAVHRGPPVALAETWGQPARQISWEQGRYLVAMAARPWPPAIQAAVAAVALARF
ncbi:hypothetical protein [Paraburkholderia sediminicola]|uniref:hypothetical protein n=1 Tax=Paraburkholderia sediminicola TaxID=458836 RepID=UPI0038BC780C